MRQPAVTGDDATSKLPNHQTLILDIDGMTCQACASRIEKVLNKKPARGGLVGDGLAHGGLSEFKKPALCGLCF